jgi:D-cysteine desulfhydrase
MLTDHLPRIALAFLPTPIEEMPNLSKTLGGPRLFIKRDDQTGLAGGGNKTRKLEFSVAEAIRQGADTLVTVGGVQSNHCRQTAAAAAKLGLNCVVVLRGHPPKDWNGNLLLDHLLGARVVFSGDQSREETAESTVRELAARGSKPFFIPLGASDAVGAMGYVAALEELDAQIKHSGQQFDRIVFASSSCGTQAGMCLGAKALGLRAKVTGIAIDSTQAELQAEVSRLAGLAAQRARLDVTISPEEVIAYDGFLGAGYAIMGEPEKEAISLAARCEGILLDPVYAGRAMAGLIGLIRQGEFTKDETILFWHTGGSAALYAYAGQLMEE